MSDPAYNKHVEAHRTNGALRRIVNRKFGRPPQTPLGPIIGPGQVGGRVGKDLLGPSRLPPVTSNHVNTDMI